MKEQESFQNTQNEHQNTKFGTGTEGSTGGCQQDVNFGSDYEGGHQTDKSGLETLYLLAEVCYEQMELKVTFFGLISQHKCVEYFVDISHLTKYCCK